MSKKKRLKPINKIQREILRTLLILVSIMTILIAAISIIVNVRSESKRVDQNLQNIAQAVARSEVVKAELSKPAGDEADSVARMYLYALQKSLSNIDVVSVVDKNNIRRYHTNDELTDTVYDGTMPDFSNVENGFYVTSDTGPSGSQRRAYAAIYDDDGNYLGFVLAVMLNSNLHKIAANAVLLHLSCALAVILCAFALSKSLSEKIKKLLLGYEPDTFSAMFSVRDNILESLEEGVLAVDTRSNVIYANKAAKKILCIESKNPEGSNISDVTKEINFSKTLEGQKSFGISIKTDRNVDIIADKIPVTEQDNVVVGALCILRDRTEYTKMMEDLSGVRYMVDSMRANNHDFVNKLHVILGLLQMGNVTQACEYITHVTTIEQSVIHTVMKKIEDPSVAALIIGKYSRAAELNIDFKLKSSSVLKRSDIDLPSGDLVTIIGNLLDNAMDSMNEKGQEPKELSLGIFTTPHAMLISVDDTGTGMTPEQQEKIFTKGVTTKGENHGTGLFVVSELVSKHSGSISVESEIGEGTSFTVTLTEKGEEENV